MKRVLTAVAGRPVALPPRGLFPSRAHVFEQEDLDALEAAIAARRPLLLRGEPGAGKSQIAEAAACAFAPQRPFVSFVVDGRTEPRDLLYQIDHVHRLATAQVAGATAAGADAGDDLETRLALRNFTRPGPLWWALSWNGACGLPRVSVPDVAEGWTPEHGVVVLIDEIDKAESDVPNGLLEALGAGRFDGPDGEPVTPDGGGEPLVIITTNAERELPDAFMRRCLVHTLSLPEDEAAFVAFLVPRGRAHFETLPPDVLERAARDLLEDRRRADDVGEARPGLAEYLDLLRVLSESGRDEAGMLEVLAVVRPFIFGKFAQSLRPDSAAGEEPA